MDAETLKALLQELLKNDDKSALLESSLAQRLETFDYQPDEGLTFRNWLDQHEDVIVKGGASLLEDARVRLLLSKLSPRAYDLYKNHVAPIKPSTRKYEATIDTLLELFPDTINLAIRRYDFFRVKQNANDFRHFGATVNSMAEKAKFRLTLEELKCWQFVIGLDDKYVDLKSKCLKYLSEKEERDADPSLTELVALCSSLVDIKETAIKLSGAATSPSSMKPHLAANAVIQQKLHRDNKRHQKYQA